MVAAYSSYAKTLGYSSMILSDKMSLQEFARFVLETPVRFWTQEPAIPLKEQMRF